MMEVLQYLPYVILVYAIFNWTVPLVNRVSKLEADLRHMKNRVNLMHSELEEIKSQFFVEGGKE